MIKFQGFGGEIGIAKDQVQSIVKAGEKESPGMVIGEEEQPLRPEADAVGEAATEKREAPADIAEKPLSPEEKLAEERAKEEKEYQKRVQELTRQIKTLRDRYALATRGSTGPEPSVPTSQEGIQARTDDLVSRLRDAQQAAGGPSAAPSVNAPLPGYTQKQKELSDLRNRLYQLEKERDRLIEEMKQKGFETGSLFLE